MLTVGLFFFFQAEDGIRYLIVTGVQTCALPILGVCPASVAPTAKPALLKGTCTRSRPSNRRKCSPMRCGGVPVPGEAKLYLAGPDLINATRSLTVWTASDGWTVSTVGEVTAIVTGSKSL